MTSSEHGSPARHHRSMAMPRHTDGLWCALVNAARDSEDELADTRRRLAALHLRRSYASIADYPRRRVG